MSQKIEEALELEKPKRPSFDPAWEAVLTEFLEDFMKLFWPAFHKDIDWSEAYNEKALEQEFFNEILSQADWKSVDKLFDVKLKNGEEVSLLLHIEQQSSSEQSFSRRMLKYFCHLFIRRDKDVATVVILSDSNPDWNPTEYAKDCYGSEVVRSFKTIKVLDYAGQEDVLRALDNPFAWVILAQLESIKVKNQNLEGLAAKQQLFEILALQLKKNQRSEKQVHDLLYFLDAILCLKPEFEIEYREQTKKFSEENNMQLMTNFEIEALEKGRQEGFQEGRQEGLECGERRILKKLLLSKFSTVPLPYLNQLESADVKALDRWLDQLLQASSLEEVFETSE